MMNKATIIGGVATFFAITALIISIIAEVTKESSTTQPKVVATENGFMGTIKDKQITIETNVTGLLTGVNKGMQLASAEEVTKQILTGYKSEGGTITTQDTILSSIGKLSINVSPSYSSKTSLQSYLTVSADIDALNPPNHLFCTTVVLGSIAIVTFEQCQITNFSGVDIFFSIELPIATTMFGSQNTIPSTISCIRQTASGTTTSDVPMTSILLSANSVQIQNVTGNSPQGIWLLSCCLFYSV